MKRSAVDPATVLKNFFRQRNLCFVGETVGDPKANFVEGRILDLNERRPKSGWQKFIGLFSDSAAEFRRIGELQTGNCDGRAGMILKIYGRDYLAGGKILADKMARLLKKPIMVELASEGKSYVKVENLSPLRGGGLTNLPLMSFGITAFITVAALWVLPAISTDTGHNLILLWLLLRVIFWFFSGI